MSIAGEPSALSFVFPKPWEPFHRPIYAEVQIVRLRWVATMLDVAGWTIHDLINSARARRAVREAWGIWKALERDGNVRREKEWRDYLAWLRQQGLPVSG